MKIIYFILFIFTYQKNIFSTRAPQEYTPDNTVLAFDMDDVFVKTHVFNLATYYLHLLFVKNPSFTWRLLTDTTFRTGIFTINLTKGQNDYGLSYNLARTAALYEPLQSIFDTILERFHSDRSLIPDVINVLRDLKSMGYTLVVATNRDRVGFEITMKHLHFDTLYQGARLFDLIVTTDSIPFIKASTDATGKRFSKKNPLPVYDGYIKSIAPFKPSKQYFENLRNFINEYAKSTSHLHEKNPHIIFFDDQQKNVDGAKKSNADITAFFVPKNHKGQAIKKALASCGIIVPQNERSQPRALPE